MKMLRHLPRILCISLLFCGLFFAAPTQAAPDPQSLRSTHYITYNPQSFRPTSAGCIYSTFDFGIFPAVDGGCSFSLNVILPGTAEVTAVTYYYYDNSAVASENLSFLFSSYNPETNISAVISNINTGAAIHDDFSTLSDNFSPSVNIDNSLNAYSLTVTIPTKEYTKLKFRGAVITYTLPVFPPLKPLDDYITIAGDNFHPDRTDSPFVIDDHKISVSTASTTSLNFLSNYFDLPAGGQVKELTYFFVDNDDNTSYIDFKFGGWLPEQGEFGSSSGFGGFFHSALTMGTPSSPNVVTKVVPMEPYMTIPDNRRFGILFYPRSPNHALRGARIRYNPGEAIRPAVQTKTLAGTDFYPSGSGWLTYQSNGGNLIPTSAWFLSAYYANIQLPPNKHIGRVTMFFRDENAAQDLSFNAQTYNLITANAASTLEYPSSAGLIEDGYDWLAFPAIQLGLTEPNYNVYRLVVHVDEEYENLTLMGARVEYYTPKLVYLPSLRR